MKVLQEWKSSIVLTLLFVSQTADDAMVNTSVKKNIGITVNN